MNWIDVLWGWLHKNKPAPIPVPTPPTPTGDYQLQILNLINSARNNASIPIVILNSKLNASSLRESADMAKNVRLSHIGSDGSTPFTRIKDAGYNYTSAGECIDYNYSPSLAFQAMFNDAAHNSIIMDDRYKDVGIGNVRNYYTLDFGSIT